MKKYLAQYTKTLLSTVKNINTKVLWSAFYDLLFYLGTLALFSVWGQYLESITIKVNLAKTAVDITAENYTNLVVYAGLSAIIMLFAVSALYAFLKGNAWLVLGKINLNLKMFSKLMFTMAGWILGWLIVLILVSASLRPTAGVVVIAVLALLIVHLTIMLGSSFALGKKRLVRLSFGQLKNIHHYIVPYITIVFGGFLVLLTGWLWVWLPDRIGALIVMVILVAYSACARLYILNVRKKR